MTGRHDQIVRTSLRRWEASRYVEEKHGIPCSIGLLNKLASTGDGPPFRKVSRYPMYEMAELDEWVQSRTSPPRRSTSECT